MEIMYIAQGLIHAFFDTRKGGINPFLNSIALIGSIILTVMNYGWHMIWLPFVVIIIGAIFGGIIMGLLLKRSRRKEN